MAFYLSSDKGNNKYIGKLFIFKPKFRYKWLKKTCENIRGCFSIINEITTSVLNSNSLEKFCNLLDKHERVMSKILELPTVKESLFPDFEGSVKSLGAWGGDFVMSVSKENPTSYFENIGYKTIISYKDMIL